MAYQYSFDSTVEYERQLAPYKLLKGGHHEDPYVREWYENKLPHEQMVALDDYTRGMYTLDLHYKSFDKYVRPMQVEEQYAIACKTDLHFHEAIKKVKQDFSVIKDLKSISLMNLESIAYVSSASAGYGYIGKKKDNHEYAMYRATKSVYHFNRFGRQYKMTPDQAFSRSQLALRANPKIRHVWGRAFHNFLIEAMTAQPLTIALSHENTPLRTGRDIHKDLPYDVRKLMLEDSWKCYGLDFSAFDSSVNYYIIETIFTDILKPLFTFDNSIDYVAFNYAHTLFRRTPLVMPDGRLFIVKTGIPSGSAYTQIVGSIANLLFIYSTQLHFLATTVPTYVLGDDSLFVTDFSVHLPLDSISEHLQKKGMAISVDKSIVTQDYNKVYFLGHNYYGSRVTREEFTLLSLALFTEDPVDKPQDTIIRVASLIYDSGYNSFGMFNLYKYLENKFNIDWKQETIRPIDIVHPYPKLFVIS